MKVNESALMHEVTMKTAALLAEIANSTDYNKVKAITNSAIGYINAIGTVLDNSDVPDTEGHSPYDMILLELLRCKKDIYHDFANWMYKANEYDKDAERLESYEKALSRRDEMTDLILEHEEDNALNT